MSEIKLAVLTMGVILLFFGATGSGDMQEEERQLASYCKMVSIHIESGGEEGWPDYKGNYSEACK
jgi:hypothetical protein